MSTHHLLLCLTERDSTWLTAEELKNICSLTDFMILDDATAKLHIVGLSERQLNQKAKLEKARVNGSLHVLVVAPTHDHTVSVLSNELKFENDLHLYDEKGSTWEWQKERNSVDSLEDNRLSFINRQRPVQ